VFSVHRYGHLDNLVLGELTLRFIEPKKNKLSAERALKSYRACAGLPKVSGLRCRKEIKMWYVVLLLLNGLINLSYLAYIAYLAYLFGLFVLFGYLAYLAYLVDNMAHMANLAKSKNQIFQK
jgi:hypothetical protein